MAKNFLKKQIISTNTAISSNNATAPMVLEMMTVSDVDATDLELTLGIEGGVVAELILGFVGACGSSNVIISVKK